MGSNPAGGINLKFQINNILKDKMPSKYEVDTKEIEFLINILTQALILFILILVIVSILYPRETMIWLILFMIIASGAFMLNTKNKIKKWKKKWSR